MSHQLINFNIPTGLKDTLDEIAKAKRLSRTAIINQLLEGYCRSALQEPAIQPKANRQGARSNSAMPANTVSTMRPAGEVVSAHGSASERRPAPISFSFSAMSSRSPV